MILDIDDHDPRCSNSIDMKQIFENEALILKPHIAALIIFLFEPNNCLKGIFAP